MMDRIALLENASMLAENLVLHFPGLPFLVDHILVLHFQVLLFYGSSFSRADNLFQWLRFRRAISVGTLEPVFGHCYRLSQRCFEGVPVNSSHGQLFTAQILLTS